MRIPALAALSFVLASCATIAPQAPKGSVDHVVLVWLKHPGNPRDTQSLRAAGDELRVIPGLQLLDHGVPLKSDRPLVDDSFDVGYVMRFDSAAALAAYEKNPLHTQKVRDVLAPLSRKIVIYDLTR